MGVFRIKKNSNYTVMSNYHLRDKTISLKAKGLLSQMFSLPDDWDYSVAGLATINKEGVDAIKSAVKELENAGYILRKRIRDSKGVIRDIEYIVFEFPQKTKARSENPPMDNPLAENPMQLNKDILNKDISNKDISNPSINQSYNNINGIDEMDRYIDLIKSNIGYEDLILTGNNKELVDEIVNLLAETVTFNTQNIKIGGSNYPAEVVKSRFLKLNNSDIEYALESLSKNTSKIKNIKKYLLVVLYNSKLTNNSYYSAEVRHDTFGGD